MDAFLWRFADGLRPSSRPLTILTQFSPNDGKTFRFRERWPKVTLRIIRIRDVRALRPFSFLSCDRMDKLQKKKGKINRNKIKAMKRVGI